MAQFFSTFITGFQEVVADALRMQLKDVKILLLLDGLVVYDTNMKLRNIESIRFFNNNYYGLKYLDRMRNDSIEFMFQSILKNPRSIPSIPREITSGASSFRIMASKENQTVSTNKALLVQIERFFSYRLGLQINRSLPDIEVWFLLRREGSGFIGIRRREKNNRESNLMKGELRPELANLLCWISEPIKKDVFLDPFAGSGAIPMERAKAFPYQHIIASDLNGDLFNKLKKRFHKTTSKITLGNWDALHLTALADESIDKIVTDPPWGLFSHQEIDLMAFYTDMLREFTRIIKREGALVILTAQKEMFEKVLENFLELKLIKKFDILVSGKKAAIYKIHKPLQVIYAKEYN